MSDKNLDFDRLGQKIVGHGGRGWVIELAARLNAELGTAYLPGRIHQWRSGKRPVPPAVWAVMRLLAEREQQRR